MTGLPESLEDILLDADAEGFQLTLHQLERWRQAGLMPKSIGSEGLGRGLGTMSYYPAGTAEQVIEIAIGLEEKHRLAYAGWRLWMLGYDVTPFVQDQLRTKARPDRPPRISRETRRVVGKVLRQRPDRFLQVLEEVMDGEFIEESLDEEKDAGWISRFWGHHRPLGEQMLLTRYFLRSVSDSIGRGSLEEVLEHLSDEELRQTQIELLTMARIASPERGSWGLGRDPGVFVPQWVALRWGDSPISRRLQEFFDDSEWPDRMRSLLKETEA